MVLVLVLLQGGRLGGGGGVGGGPAKTHKGLAPTFPGLQFCRHTSKTRFVSCITRGMVEGFGVVEFVLFDPLGGPGKVVLSRSEGLGWAGPQHPPTWNARNYEARHSNQNLNHAWCSLHSI